MRCGRHIACMGCMGKAHKIFRSQIFEGKRQLYRFGADVSKTERENLSHGNRITVA
jgi:hypothetical protein